MGPKHSGPNSTMKGDIMICSCYRGVKFFEHGIKMVQKQFRKNLCRIVTVNLIQFGLTPEKGTIILCTAFYIMWRIYPRLMYNLYSPKCMHLCTY